MKVLFSSDDRLRRPVVWPESRAKPQLQHSCTVAMSSLSLGTPDLILRNDMEKVSYNPIRFLSTVEIFARCNNHLCRVSICILSVLHYDLTSLVNFFFDRHLTICEVFEFYMKRKRPEKHCLLFFLIEKGNFLQPIWRTTDVSLKVINN